MPRWRLVEWFERLAGSHPPAIQRDRSRDTRTMEAPVPGGGNIDLRVGIWIRVFYLEPQDTKDLADLHLRDARWDRAHDGNVSVRAHHDRPQRGGVRPWSHRRTSRTNQSAASGSCLVELLHSTFCFCHGYLPSIKRIGIVRFPKG
jgi:hypothetical protein